MSEFRRWYDNDPVLKEALELLSISAEEVKDESASFLMNLQDQVAKDVIERLYEQIQDYQVSGNRWYDKDPVMLKAIELLRVAPASVQRQAAKKLLKALSKDTQEEAEEL
ncbi:MAG: hypothetical protein PHX18_08845 [Candidatus Gastranaerophilales bacterium]|nr:hypothetical protein [Candidatus Gastranaerophilales bacterium]